MVGRMPPGEPQPWPDERYLPWSQAMERALYGSAGFYRTRGGPAAHFRTSVHASPLFATAILRLLHETDRALGYPDEIALVDVGAGRGELLESVSAQLSGEAAASAQSSRPLLDRLRLIAVERADRPDDLTRSLVWQHTIPGDLTGLLIANEWLDNVPCDVVRAAPDGWRTVEVAADGTERLGAAPDAAQAAWLASWWPAPASDGSSHGGESGEDGSVSLRPPARAEIGLTRDAAWQQAVASLRAGVAIAIDYAHTRGSRPRFGTLTGYADGRQTMPIPDGTRDITAHVALDACAAATATRVDWTVHATQREVIHSLGITGARPSLTLASSDPRGYLRALSQASAAAELTDLDGLGGFGWLAQGVNVPCTGPWLPLQRGLTAE